MEWWAVFLGVLLYAAPSVSTSEPLLVFAATSTTESLEEVGRLYEAASGTRVSFSFGASSELARQIIAGAPADVFVSADEAQMDRVELAKKALPADRVDVAHNALVLVAAKGTAIPATLRELTVLSTLALADPEAVPAGVYARRALESQGLWDAVKPHVIPMQDVRGALAAVRAKRAQAAIVYATDARMAPELQVSPPHFFPDVRIAYPAAAVLGPHAAQARAFVAFIRTAPAQAVLRAHGFLAADASR